MQRHNVDGLNFDFPDDWQVSKYDDWSYYRNQFAKMWNGIKSLDLLAVDPVQTAWLIEVKDYRVNQRTKPSKLRPQAINPADLKQKIRQLLKPVDATPNSCWNDHHGGPWMECELLIWPGKGHPDVP